MVPQGGCNSEAKLRRAFENTAQTEMRVLAFMAHGEEEFVGLSLASWATREASRLEERSSNFFFVIHFYQAPNQRVSCSPLLFNVMQCFVREAWLLLAKWQMRCLAGDVQALPS